MSATKPINRAPQCSLRLVSQRRAGVTEIKAAKPKDGRLSGGVPGGAVTQAAAGAQGLPGAGSAAPSRLRLTLLPLAVEKRKANVRRSCALCESRVAPAGKGETCASPPPPCRGGGGGAER